MPVLSESLLAVAVLMGAYFVRGLAGFGSGLIAVPLLALWFPLTIVVPLVVALDYLGSLAQALNNRGAVSWSELWPLLPSTVVGIGLALFLFDVLDPETLHKALGLFVFSIAVYQLFPLPQLHASRLAAIPNGVFGGLMGTLFGTGGPFYMLYLSMRALDKSTVRASFAMWFVIDGMIRLLGYVVSGVATVHTFKIILAAAPFAMLSLYLGGRVHSGVSATQFKRLISLLLVGSGVALMVR